MEKVVIKGRVVEGRSDDSHFVIETELGYETYSRNFYEPEIESMDTRPADVHRIY